MIERLTDEEIDFVETFFNPVAMAETLFTDYDNLSLMKDENLAHIRLYQIPLLSHEYLLDEDPNLSEKENFQLRKSVGDVWALGGRLFGKTMCVEKLDLLISVPMLGTERVGFSSYDALHIRGVLEEVIQCLEHHPFFRLFKPQITRSPNYRIQFNNGYLVEGVNMNLTGKKPGCFDDKTEILTEDGWKFFKDLEDNDKVLTLDPSNNESYFCPIAKKIEYEYNGDLLNFSSRTGSFLVTPDHNMMLVNNGKKVKIEANKINNQQIYFQSYYKYSGIKNDIVIEGKVNGRYKKYVFNCYKWVKFLAWYLSEGSITISSNNKYRIQIPQKNNVDRLLKVINGLGIKCCVYFDKKLKIYRIDIRDKNIFQHLLKYCGKTKTKRVPKYLFKYDSSVAKTFIDEYLYGDGCIYLQKGKYEHKSVFTSLKLLSDDLQIIAQHAGYKTNLRKKVFDSQINGREYKDNVIYVVTLCVSKNSVFKNKNIKTIPYKGKVYCVEVKPHHSIFVRRNGHVIWTFQSQFFQKHFTRLYIEEASFETNQIYEQRRDSVSENGCIFRIAGMTNFIKYSPCGKVFYDYSKRRSIVNLPQKVNPKWDENKRKDSIKDFGGELSINFRIFIDGEVVEEGVSVFDMQRVRNNYNEKRSIKNFEVSKKFFAEFKNQIVVEKPRNSLNGFLFADIGESAPTEIGVIFQINENYRYEYNITLYNLTDKEQFKIFEWLITELKINYVGIDCTDGTGRAIYRSLEEIFPKENLIWVAFNEKLPIDFEKHPDTGETIFKDGKPVYKEEYVIEWSIKNLKDLLYGSRMDLPIDYKFDMQMNSVISMKSGTRTVYNCTSPEDHLFQSFQVFSIMQWLCEFLLLKPIVKKKFCKSGV